MGSTPFPIADRAAGRKLGSVLRRLGYDEDGITDLLGDEAYEGDREDATVHVRRLPDTKLATAVRAFFLGLPVSLEDASKALGDEGLGALASTGLAEIDGEVVPRTRLTAIGDLLVASDGYSRDEEDPADYVATYTPTTRLLDLLTPRPRIAQALDVGTGCGAHALLAARHSKHVVATDVNPRALAFTELNAALNGLDNVECRGGALFEPVTGETFDLIICNAPYVVSPETRYIYRDAGLRGDEVSRRLVHGAAEHLTEGGYATLLVSWIAEDEESADDRPIVWVEETDCAGWVLSVSESAPLDHAAEWNSELASDPDAFGAALDEWTSYMEGLGANWISEGAILLHRARGNPKVRVDGVDEDDLEPASNQIRRAFDARARLAELRANGDLLAERLAPAASLRIEYELARGRRTARVWLDEGTCPELDVPPAVADAIASLDGKATLAKVAGTDAKLRRGVLRAARELLEVGALRFA